MTFRLDNGKFPAVNYNRVVKRSRRELWVPRPDVTSPAQVAGMYRIAQDMNGVVEPQLAIRKPQGGTRRGLI